MIRFRLALIVALLTFAVPAAAQGALVQAQAKRYATKALAHKFGTNWSQRDRGLTYFKCRRKATLKFACRVVWLRRVVVYDGNVGISLRPDPSDDGWYYDLKIKRTDFGCSNLCRKTIVLHWTRGGPARGSG